MAVEHLEFVAAMYFPPCGETKVGIKPAAIAVCPIFVLCPRHGLIAESLYGTVGQVMAESAYGV